MKIGALALFALATVAQAQYSHPMPQNPVTLAAYDATLKCVAILPETSFDSCGTMNGASPARSAARRAMGELYRQRNEFMNGCDRKYGLERCNAIVGAMIDEGMQRALVDK